MDRDDRRQRGQADAAAPAVHGLEPAPLCAGGRARVGLIAVGGDCWGWSMNGHAFATAADLAAEIRARRIGCLELLDFYLARAERFNPALNAIVAWQIDRARERAR